MAKAYCKYFRNFKYKHFHAMLLINIRLCTSATKFTVCGRDEERCLITLFMQLDAPGEVLTDHRLSITIGQILCPGLTRDGLEHRRRAAPIVDCAVRNARAPRISRYVGRNIEYVGIYGSAFGTSVSSV